MILVVLHQIRQPVLEIKPHAHAWCLTSSHTLDSELQQRACEHLALVSMPQDDLLRTVCDEMPPFRRATSPPSMSRLHPGTRQHERQADTGLSAVRTPTPMP